MYNKHNHGNVELITNREPLFIDTSLSETFTDRLFSSTLIPRRSDDATRTWALKANPRYICRPQDPVFTLIQLDFIHQNWGFHQNGHTNTGTTLKLLLRGAIVNRTKYCY